MKIIKAILENLHEQFAIGFEDHYGKYHEVFVNPDKKEVRDASTVFNGELRFIADKDTKKVYISDSDVLHDDIQKQIGTFRKHYWDLFSGIALVSGGKIQVGSTNSNDEPKQEVIMGDYDWLERYSFSNLQDMKLMYLQYFDTPEEDWEYALAGEDVF